MTFPLLIEYLADATANDVNHIEIHHRIAKTLIAVVTLWPMRSKSFLHSARDETASVGIIQKSWILHKIDSLLQGIILMCDTVMKHFAHGIVIVLLHHIWEHCAAGHFTHCQVMYFGKYLVNCQDEWSREVFIVNNIFMFIT